MAGPTLWFGMAVLGLLFLYWEVASPGRYWPVVPGAVGFLWGLFRLLTYSPRPGGVILLALSAVFLSSEIWTKTKLYGAVLGTASLICGALRLYERPPKIHPAVAIAGGLMAGVTGSWLSHRAGEARRRKRRDL